LDYPVRTFGITDWRRRFRIDLGLLRGSLSHLQCFEPARVRPN